MESVEAHTTTAQHGAVVRCKLTRKTREGVEGVVAVELDNPTFPERPYVTWCFVVQQVGDDPSGKASFFWGHYDLDEHQMVTDFEGRR
jgi:hypothetical protein